MLKLISSVVKTTTAVIVMLLAVTTVSAQDRAEKIAMTQTDRMKTELKLSEEQYNQVLEVNKEFNKKIAETRKSDMEAGAKTDATKALSKERDEKLKSVLTDEQHKNYLKNKESLRKKFQGGNSVNGGMNVRPTQSKQQ